MVQCARANLYGVVASSYYRALPDNNSAYRHFCCIRGIPGFEKRKAHPRFMVGDFVELQASCPRWNPQNWSEAKRSALRGSRTPNLLIRSQMLYPIEL